MTKIYTRNQRFTGQRGNVSFVEGVGETTDKNALKWFAGRGNNYSVGKPFPDAPAVATGPGAPDYSQFNVPELKEFAKAEGIEGYASMTKAELIEALTPE